MTGAVNSRLALALAALLLLAGCSTEPNKSNVPSTAPSGGVKAAGTLSKTTPGPELLGETDITSYLTSQGLDVQVKSHVKAALTPLGTTDTSLVLVEDHEISIAVFASPSEAAQGLERGMATARWSKPTTLLLWRNVVVVVTNSDNSSGLKIVEALEPVAELIKTTP